MRKNTLFEMPNLIEEVFLICGGVNTDRYTLIVALKARFPELKHRIEVHDELGKQSWLLLSNRPLREDHTEQYIQDLAKQRGNVIYVAAENQAGLLAKS